MKTNFLIFLTIVLTSNSFAEDSFAIKKGDVSPVTGIVMTTEKANKVRTQLIEHDGFEKLNDSLVKSLSISNGNYDIETKKNSILESRNDELAKRLQESVSTTNFERIVWTAVGVVGTGAAIWGASKLHK